MDSFGDCRLNCLYIATDLTTDVKIARSRQNCPCINEIVVETALRHRYIYMCVCMYIFIHKYNCTLIITQTLLFAIKHGNLKQEVKEKTPFKVT